MNTVELNKRFLVAKYIVARGYETARTMQRAAKRHAKKSLDKAAVSSIVTDADLAIEALMRQEIRKHFPHDHIIGEEEGAAALDTQYPSWALDPIDGTKNYANGLPLWAVSAAVLEHGVPVVGAVSARDHCYTARRDIDAVWRDDAPFVRQLAPATPPNLAIERFDKVFNRDEIETALRETGVRLLENLGSCIGECMRILEGTLDGYINPCPAIWDWAAVAILFEKAGIAITRWDGTAPFPSIWHTIESDVAAYLENPTRFDMFAAPPSLHETFLPVVKRCHLLPR